MAQKGLMFFCLPKVRLHELKTTLAGLLRLALRHFYQYQTCNTSTQQQRGLGRDNFFFQEGDITRNKPLLVSITAECPLMIFTTINAHVCQSMHTIVMVGRLTGLKDFDWSASFVQSQVNGTYHTKKPHKHTKEIKFASPTPTYKSLL